ncbi:MAG: hypothetical protein PG980_000225 [Wolbachia endosymbiont of Ctenocephalides felis wCfeJ]|nr:MAG: hypothetical protein PG980_000225 [Wolbachia endosymbiont of Ctenocephalides felis wCfeJ]
MNKTLKNATVKKYYYRSHQQLKDHLYDFVMAYNYAKRLKTLNGLTPFEFICSQWTQSPDLFILNPYHHTLGPYILETSYFRFCIKMKIRLILVVIDFLHYGQSCTNIAISR